MMRRLVWFILGALAAVWAMIKGRNVAYRLTPSGIVDQAGALGVGWREFRTEFNEGVQGAEEHIAQELFSSEDMKELN